VRIIIAALRNVLIVAMLRLLGLAHCVGPALDRQFISLWPRRRWWRPDRIVVLLRRAVLPILILAVVLVLTVVLTSMAIVVLHMRLIVLSRLIILRARLIVAAMALIVSLMAIRPVLPALGPTVLRLIGQRLSSDAYTQQTNTGHTPDARLHAFPHCGLGPVRKTGKVQAGSATGYQSRNLFIEDGREIQGQEKGETRRPPLENFVRARRL
jgi:hypothetical protein